MILNAEQAKSVLNRFNSDYFVSFSVTDLREAETYLNALNGPEVKILLDAIKNVTNQITAFGEKQRKLLVEGQSLESASKNWEEAGSWENNSLDFGPLFKALNEFERSVK